MTDVGVKEIVRRASVGRVCVCCSLVFAAEAARFVDLIARSDAIWCVICVHDVDTLLIEAHLLGHTRFELRRCGSQSPQTGGMQLRHDSRECIARLQCGPQLRVKFETKSASAPRCVEACNGGGHVIRSVRVCQKKHFESAAVSDRQCTLLRLRYHC